MYFIPADTPVDDIRDKGMDGKGESCGFYGYDHEKSHLEGSWSRKLKTGESVLIEYDRAQGRIEFNSDAFNYHRNGIPKDTIWAIGLGVSWKSEFKVEFQKIW